VIGRLLKTNKETILKKAIYLTAIASAFLLTACVTTRPTINLNDPQAMRGAIEIKRDEFKKITNFTGPNATAGYGDLAIIHAWKYDTTGDMDYQIYIRDLYDQGTWRNYFTAFDSNGKQLKIRQISRDVLSCSRSYCSFWEHIGIDVTREYLEQHRNSGIRLKLSGQVGEEIFYFPGAYIEAILSVAK
jgi:hypothetical protein